MNWDVDVFNPAVTVSLCVCVCVCVCVYMYLCRKKRRGYVHLSAVNPSRGAWERNSISEVWMPGIWSLTDMTRMRRVKNPSAWLPSRANIRVEVWGVSDMQDIHGALCIHCPKGFRLYEDPCICVFSVHAVLLTLSSFCMKYRNWPYLFLLCWSSVYHL